MTDSGGVTYYEPVLGQTTTTHDLDGWDPAEIVKPGFAQVDLSGVTPEDAQAWIHRAHTPIGTVVLARVAKALADRLLTALDLTPPAARYAGQVTDADGTTRIVSHLDQRER